MTITTLFQRGIKGIFILGFIAALAACGGGGSSDNTASSQTAISSTAPNSSVSSSISNQVTSSSSISTTSSNVSNQVTSSSSVSTSSSSSIAPDTTPEAFSFIPVDNAETQTVYVSNTITVTGINTATMIIIVGGEYAIDNGSYTSLPGFVSNNQTVRVRLTSSALFDTESSASLFIGNVGNIYQVTTGSDVSPPCPDGQSRLSPEHCVKSNSALPTRPTNDEISAYLTDEERLAGKEVAVIYINKADVVKNFDGYSLYTWQDCSATWINPSNPDANGANNWESETINPISSTAETADPIYGGYFMVKVDPVAGTCGNFIIRAPGRTSQTADLTIQTGTTGSPFDRRSFVIEDPVIGLASVYMNGSPICISDMCADTSDIYKDTDIFVRGSIAGDWAALEENKMTFITGGIYTVSLQVTAGAKAFKIADASWVVVNLGASAGDEATTLGTSKGLVVVGNDIHLTFPIDGTYLFSLDTSNPNAQTVTVTAP